MNTACSGQACVSPLRKGARDLDKACDYLMFLQWPQIPCTSSPSGVASTAAGRTTPNRTLSLHRRRTLLWGGLQCTVLAGMDDYPPLAPAIRDVARVAHRIAEFLQHADSWRVREFEQINWQPVQASCLPRGFSLPKHAATSNSVNAIQGRLLCGSTRSAAMTVAAQCCRIASSGVAGEQSRTRLC